MGAPSFLKNFDFDKGKDSFHRLASHPRVRKGILAFEELLLFLLPGFLIFSLRKYLLLAFFYALGAALMTMLLVGVFARKNIRLWIIHMLFAFSGAAFFLGLWNIYDIGSLYIYADTSVYLKVSRFSLSSLNFWALGGRPFVTPLILKIFNRNMAAVNDFYIIIYLLASLALIFAVTRFFKTSREKLMVGYIFIFFFLNQHDMSLWISCGMSELPSIVMVVLTIAAFGLAFSHRQHVQASPFLRFAAIGTIIILGILLAFSRDSNAYFLPFMVPFYWAVFPKLGQRIFLSVCLLLIFILATLSVKQAKRWEFSLGNVLYQRIIPNDKLRRLFQREYNFPEDEDVMPCAKLWFQQPCAGKNSIVAWMNHYGLGTYRIFLLKHPRYVFGEWIKAWDIQQENLWILERNPKYFADKRVRLKRLNDFIFNFPGTVSFPLAIFLGIFGILFLRRNPLILFCLTYSSIVGILSFHGDAQAVSRHLQQPMMALKLAFLLVLLQIYSLVRGNGSRAAEGLSSSGLVENQRSEA